MSLRQIAVRSVTELSLDAATGFKTSTGEPNAAEAAATPPSAAKAAAAAAAAETEKAAYIQAHRIAHDKRNNATVSTWHPDEQGIQIKRVDGSLVHVRKGSIVSVVYYKPLLAPRIILRVQDFANSGRSYPGHPIGFLYDYWIPTEGRWKPSYDGVVGLYPGSLSHQIFYVDVDSIRHCDDPSGEIEPPLYILPSETSWSRGKTLLHVLKSRQTEEAMRLLDAGADSTFAHPESWDTALHCACRSQMESVMVRLILAGAARHLKNRAGHLPKALLQSDGIKAVYERARKDYADSLRPVAPVAPVVPVAPVAPVAPVTGIDAPVWIRTSTEATAVPIRVFQSRPTTLPHPIVALLSEYPVVYIGLGDGRWSLEVHRGKLRDLCARVGRRILEGEVKELLCTALSPLCAVEPGPTWVIRI